MTPLATPDATRCPRSSRMFGVSWIEGRPETAISWRWYPLSFWAEFVLSIRAFRVTPTKLKRIKASWWWCPVVDGSPIEVAKWLEGKDL